MTSAAAKAAATSPSSECSSAMTFRSGRPMRAVAASSLPPVDRRGAGAQRVLRGEHRVQQLVLHLQRPDAGFRRGHGLGDDGGDPLPDEPHHVVEHPGVVGIVGVQLVLRGGKQLRGCVFVGEDRLDAGNCQRVRGIDGQHAGVGMRGAQELQVQQAREFRRRHVQGVARRAGDDRPAGGRRDVVTELAGTRTWAGSRRRSRIPAPRGPGGWIRRARPRRRRRPRWPGSRCSGRGSP